MKKMTENTLSIVCMLAIILACGQTEDGSCDLIWTLSFLAIALICGLVLRVFFNCESVHIADATYYNLNSQIADIVGEMEDGRKMVDITSDNVTIKVCLQAKTSRTKFTDDAWGNVQTFTEDNFYCSVIVCDVFVYDRHGKLAERHDFDESFIENEYESTGNWR